MKRNIIETGRKESVFFGELAFTHTRFGGSFWSFFSSSFSFKIIFLNLFSTPGMTCASFIFKKLTTRCWAILSRRGFKKRVTPWTRRCTGSSSKLTSMTAGSRWSRGRLSWCVLGFVSRLKYEIFFESF